MNLYVCNQGAQISLKDNQFQVQTVDDTCKSFPIHMVDMIEVFGNVQITAQATKCCLKEHILVIYYTASGHLIGRLSPVTSFNPNRIQKQYQLLDSQEVLLAMNRKIVKAKIHNQFVVLKRFARKRSFEIDEETASLFTALLKRVDRAKKRDQLMGLEGIAAKEYFQRLGKLPDTQYQFKRRSRRPAKDPANAALNMGYSILMNEILGVITGEGFLAEIGIFHTTGYNRPALACDLMEEWRPVIIDSTVISMFTGHEFQEMDFQILDKDVYLSHSGMKKLIRKIQRKMDLGCSYLKNSDKKMTFHNAIAHQVFSFGKMLDTSNVDEYMPIMLR